ncbi:methyltransferase domain-containing protein [Acidimicrobiaceae bacterium USS-CC1]|uniref:Methyltransferase domain-containing protein n=1 Tax=Acidiferrimicrobium australe TaxID=2664430 RepID=A0ABW9QW92_9ACTN|nr:methyltransferase domain-containing protein [Acidiferrimicrobium australe]
MSDDTTDHGAATPPSPGAVWDQRYADTDWPSEPDDALVELAAGLPPGRALDLGCGPGRNAIWLARQGWTVTGIDASAVGLRIAGERAREAGVTLELVQADVLTYTPPPASVDLVVVANLHFAPGEREGFFSRAAMGVRPGGHLYVNGHHLDALGLAGPPVPERLYTEELLADLLAPLEVVVSRRERPAHDGGRPLVDAVAWATVPPDGGEAR